MSDQIDNEGEQQNEQEQIKNDENIQVVQEEPKIEDNQDNIPQQAPRENQVVDDQFQIESESDNEQPEKQQQVKQNENPSQEEENQLQRTEEQFELKNQDNDINNNIKKTILDNGAVGLVMKAGQEIEKNINSLINKSEAKKIVNQAALERKTEAFEQSKSWEHLRMQQIQAHKQIVESVWGRIQKNVLSSDDSMKFLVQFLKARIEQEETQLKFLSGANLSKLFKEFDGKIVQSQYPEFSKAIRVVDQQQERQCDQLRIFIAWMSNQIRERLEQEMTNFDKQNKDMNQNYNKQRKTLAELEKDVLKYYAKYEKLYLNMSGKGKKYQKDFLTAELKYRFASQKLIVSQREFGNWLLNSWNDIIALENQRIELVTLTIIDMQNQIMNTYGKLPSFDSVIASLQNLKGKIEVQTLYSINYILNKQEIEYIQNDQMQEIDKYFNSFQIPDKFAELSHPLILKVFHAQKDVGTIGKTWQDIGIIITVDHYCLIFQNRATRYSKPESKYPVEGLKLNKKTNFEIELIFIIPGLVLDSKKKMLIQFQKADELEEFAYYLETVGQNKFAQ